MFIQLMKYIYKYSYPFTFHINTQSQAYGSVASGTVYFHYYWISFYNTSFSSLSFSAFFCSNFSFTLKLKKKIIKYDVQCSSKQITRKRSEFNAKFCIYLILAFDYIQSLQFHAKFFMLLIFDTYTMPPID